MMRRSTVTVLLAVVALVATACGGDDDKKETSAGGQEPLVGLFRLTPGTCSDAGVTAGTYFRMIQPGGKLGEGPYVPNGDSSCGDKTWSPMTPGTDGGLRTGTFQPQDSQPFDAGGNGVSNKIAQPTKWFAVTYSIATNEQDPQTNTKAKQPELYVTDGKLSGDLSAYAAAWNGQHFNQGSPKPGGQRPGLTTGPTGTYDPATKKFTLEWTSQIVGGPFNNFTGTWHFEGTFEKA
jgi:hypothetical protein